MTQRYHIAIFSAEGAVSAIKTCASPEEADAAVVAVGEGSVGFRLDGVEDVKSKLSMAQMIALHNSLRPTKPIKTFHDAGKGANRVMGLLEAPATAEGTASETAGETAMKTKSKNRPNPRRKTDGQGRPSKFPADAKIKILKPLEETGKREGTWSAKQYAMYRNGMTVGTLLEKGAKTAYIAWDVDHGIIKIEKSASA